MSTRVKEIILQFFKGQKCQVIEHRDFIMVKNIPGKLQENFGLNNEAVICFDRSMEGIYVDDKSDLFLKIKSYLKNETSKTLLKIDFDFPDNIREKIKLRNCSINDVEKKQENNYFSRFTFLTTFRFLNKTEQVVNEIFVHNGEIVNGDLKDYNVEEGDPAEASTEHIAREYAVAKEKLQELLAPDIVQASKALSLTLEVEKERIMNHYEKILNEFTTNRKILIQRIEEARVIEDLNKVEKHTKSLNKNYPDEELKKIENEIEEVINNEKSKHALGIENKLIDTTVIYYPIFRVTVQLKDHDFEKNIELVYNPLTNEVDQTICDSCKIHVEEINLCHGGHVCCNSCLHLCGVCGKRFCKDCFKGGCTTCGKLICYECEFNCDSCDELLCQGCVRTVTRTGRSLCAECSSFCPQCSTSIEKESLIESSTGEKICRTCFSKEQMKEILPSD